MEVTSIREAIRGLGGTKEMKDRIIRLTGEGIAEVEQVIADTTDALKKSGFFDKNRNEQKKEWIHENIRTALVRDFYQSEKIRKVLSGIESAVINNQRSVLSAYHELLDIYKKQ